MASGLIPGAFVPAITNAPIPPPIEHLFSLLEHPAVEQHLGMLKKRQTFDPSDYGSPIGCNYGNYYSSCTDETNRYIQCFSGSVSSFNLDSDDYQECLCGPGIEMMDCTLNALEKSGCWDGLDAGSFQLEMIEALGCENIPPSFFAQIEPPKTIFVELDPIRVTTPRSAVTPPPLTYSPLFQGQGGLLTGRCSSRDFTLVDADNTVFWAPFVGCNADRPECCPWQAVNTQVAGAKEDTTITVEVSIPTDGELNANAVNYPIPEDADDAFLDSCPDDYYTVSAGDACCPVGHFPFTRAIGGQTPCWSSVFSTSAPTLTAGLDFNPNLDSGKPTSAVVNIVYSMQYPVRSGGSKLSTAAIVGIAAGSGVALIIIGVLVFFLMRSKKQAKDAAAAGGAAPGTTAANVSPGPPSTVLTDEKSGIMAPMAMGHTPSPSTHTNVSYPSGGTPSQLQPHQTGSSAVSDPSTQGYYGQQQQQQQPSQQFAAIPEAGSAMYGQQQPGQMGAPQPVYNNTNAYAMPQQPQQPQQQWQQYPQQGQGQGQYVQQPGQGQGQQQQWGQPPQGQMPQPGMYPSQSASPVYGQQQPPQQQQVSPAQSGYAYPQPPNMPPQEVVATEVPRRTELQ